MLTTFIKPLYFMSNIIYRACNVNGKMQIKLYFIYESNT